MRVFSRFVMHRLPGTLLVALLAALPLTASARYTLPPAPSLAWAAIYPFVPTPRDTIAVSIFDQYTGTFLGLPAAASDVQVQVVGNEIRITATLVEATGPVGGPIRVPLPPLPEGRYVVVYDGSANMPDPERHRAQTAFSVSSAGYATVVEFYHAALDHYFITSAPDEIAKLDQGIIRGWTRTGESFRAIVPAVAASTATPVCRMYGLPEFGIDSHFFSAGSSECDVVAQKWPDRWILETPAAFAIPPLYVGPNASNTTCGDDMQPLYRLYNNRADANHRYTTSRASRDQMLAKGWILEGPTYDFYPEVPGDVRAIAMCVLR